jgi:hypothetical protein
VEVQHSIFLTLVDIKTDDMRQLLNIPIQQQVKDKLTPWMSKLKIVMSQQSIGHREAGRIQIIFGQVKSGIMRQ